MNIVRRLRRVSFVVAPVVAVAVPAALAASGCNLGSEEYDRSSRGFGTSPPPGPQPVLGPTVIQEETPPPIAGGTLLAGRRGTPSLVADPDRHRLHVVDVGRGTSRDIVLPKDDEPGRAVLDANGRAHVAMRASGDLVTVDLGAASIVERRHACIAARGVAYDRASDGLVVACAEGEIVFLPAGGGPVARRVEVERDVRDVWVTDDVIYVSRFRSAEVLTLRRDGSLLRKRVLKDANVAWRMIAIARPEGSGAVSTDEEEDAGAGAEVRDGGCAEAAGDDGGDAGADGGIVRRDAGACEEGEAARRPPADIPEDVPIIVDQLPADPPPTPTPRGYYGGGTTPCTASSIVRTRVEMYGGGSIVLPDAVLPVDVATNGRQVAVVAAGNGHTPGLAQMLVFDARGSLVPAGRSDVGSGSSGGTGSGSSSGFTGGCEDILRVELPGQPVAAAFDGEGRLLVQSREPAALYVMSPDLRSVRRTIRLSDESREDTGHAIFHANSGGFIACASCHPEGGDDARVWTFDVGKRRTPALRGTVAHTQPFHWAGDMADTHALVEHVFVNRMNGPRIDTPQEGALEHWMFGLPTPKPPVAISEASRRGEVVYAARSCGSCHGGPMLTNNATVNVGTGEPVQVPSLRGVGWRAPYLHTGCAKTLRDRFTPGCGGSAHGNVDGMTTEEIDDLAAYLETL